MHRTPTTSTATTSAARKNTTPSPRTSPPPAVDAAKTFIRRPERKRRSIGIMDAYQKRGKTYDATQTDQLFLTVMETFENIPSKVSEYPQMRKDIKAYLEEKSDKGLKVVFELSRRMKEMEVELETLRARSPLKDSTPDSAPELEKRINERLAKVEDAISEGLAGLETKIAAHIEEPMKDIHKKVQYLDPSHAEGVLSKIEEAKTYLEDYIDKESLEIQVGYRSELNEISQDVQKLGEDTKRIRQGIQDLSTAKQTGIQPEAPTTYAKVAAAKPGRRPALHSVAITLEGGQETADEVLARVKKAVDARGTGIKINKVRKAKNQTVILGCDTESELLKVKERIESRGEGLTVAPMRNKNPLVVLKDVVLENEDDEMVKALYAQNEDIFMDLPNEEREIAVKYKKRTRNPKTAHVVVQVRPRVWQRMTEAGALYIDMQRIRVEDQSPLIQCTMCLAFGHGRKFCTHPAERCSHCGGPHLREKCEDFFAGNGPQCCNCTQSKLQRTDHSAFSAECPVRQKWDYLARTTTAYT